MLKGKVFDIQRYSVHDGRGIRTIVFLKGCTMRCKWCSNPESQKFETEEMVVNNQTRVVGKDMTVEEVMEIVDKDRAYYRRTKGGLTLSGGECLNQPEFSQALLMASKQSMITTAIESMAAVKYDIIEAILPYLDQFLMDIKHINSEKHKLYTGVANELILENARKVAQSNMTELSIRIPVIPGFNDHPDEIKDIACFAKDIGNVSCIHLLPYHRLGQDKYEGLGRKYPMTDILPPSSEKIKGLKAVVESNCDIECKIGG
ncbi:glycyl-radical activating family protein [Candidatus Epulonipiscium fishelsonii]|uniref:Glycyl-radical activating family protein n=1 Tax=Candidatus Epulonipiscium fishelsonii TaxID=77094 RepID=A0ACC8X6T5_9FIRM|nr:glycyl-radical activating family protein [Epulopiscium sp. SCG-B11WGA-EpuloA1]ONI38330.1 glycyl-radical activating family protein [Epulopiscium sp. SCG-B05WGA-EpuloA1]